MIAYAPEPGQTDCDCKTGISVTDVQTENPLCCGIAHLLTIWTLLSRN